MQINKITFTPAVSNTQIKNNDQINNKQNEPLTYTINPINNYAYRDYNITFGDRLFRTPANFFAQPFNKNNMPDTMKEYLNADYSDRQNMPPAQMLRLVFDDLNEIKSLDFVPRIFPNEPLFKDLTDTPKRNARIGLVSEFEALKSEMGETPLFKDGTSNLGMYILKKIYLEGKTVSEINKDFRNDIANDYKDLITAEIDHATTSAYGIKFPKRPFWKSFVATREDFPYEYKPRKNKNGESVKKDEKSIASLNERYRTEEDRRPQKFSTDKDFDKKGKKMGDAIIDTHGDDRKLENALRHKGISDKEEISFVCKYFGPIMSIALEKIHASEEMRDYFENYDTLTKKQRQRMEGYWKHNPFMREYQSLAISDTIKFFYEAYGADGNNDEFRELLEYAAKIKPDREYRDELHRQKQLELEETFADYNVPSHLTDEEQTLKPEAITEATPKTKAQPTDKELKDMVIKEAMKNGAEIISFTAPDGSVHNFIVNINDYYSKQMSSEFKLLPETLVKKFISYSLKSPLFTPEYRRSVVLLSQKDKLPDFVKEQLLSVEECRRIAGDIKKAFDKKYAQYMIAGEQALAERIVNRVGTDFAFLLRLDAMAMLEFAALNDVNITNWTDAEREKLNNSYQEYLRPIKDKNEINKINEKMVHYLTCHSPESKEWKNEEFAELEDLFALLSATARQYPHIKSALSKLIKKSSFIENYGGSARMLLNEDNPEKLKITKAKLMLEQLLKCRTDELTSMLCIDEKLIRMYINDSRLKIKLLNNYYHNNR